MFSKVIASFLLFTSFATLAFDAGEHALLGDMAFEKHSKKYENKISNLIFDLDYTYGHLVALSGDMYKSIEEVALDEQKLLKKYYIHNRKKLIQCVDKEVNAILHGSEYLKCDELNIIKRKFRYLTLAHDNFSHFGWHNIKEYIKYHKKALWFAKLAFLKCDQNQLKANPKRCKEKQLQIEKITSKSQYKKKLSKKYKYLNSVLSRRKLTKHYLNTLSKDKLLDLALFNNAYADHFLTDAFSAGHLRVPRAQIDYFAEHNTTLDKSSKRSREEGSVVSGALTQYLHNLDGHLHGLSVKNSRGDSFLIRGDKQLFAKLGSDELHFSSTYQTTASIPIEAVVNSLQDVFNVFETGSLPAKYSALELVPFPNTSVAKPLSEVVEQHINEEGSVKSAVKLMSKEMQNLFKGSAAVSGSRYRELFIHFTEHLPPMMNSLQQYVKQDAQEQDDMFYIPLPLMNSFKNIN